MIYQTVFTYMPGYSGMPDDTGVGYDRLTINYPAAGVEGKINAFITDGKLNRYTGSYDAITRGPNQVEVRTAWNSRSAAQEGYDYVKEIASPGFLISAEIVEIPE